MTETEVNLFEKFEESVLNEYNTAMKKQVDKYDTYFKSYLVGRMSMMIPAEQFHIHTKKKGE